MEELFQLYINDCRFVSKIGVTVVRKNIYTKRLKTHGNFQSDEEDVF